MVGLFIECKGKKKATVSLPLRNERGYMTKFNICELIELVLIRSTDLP